MAKEPPLSRTLDLQQFYCLLSDLARRTGEPMPLQNLLENGVPERGIYFFFEPSEKRLDSGKGVRVVRVGTHALTDVSHSTLRQRLRQHRGTLSGNGNHRGSIFRLLVGQALLMRDGDLRCSTWGVGQTNSKVPPELRVIERDVEGKVSSYVAGMQVLLLPVLDAPSRASARARIEAGSIALLSNHDRTPLDVASPQWLGRYSNRPLVRSSGLWNQRHVESEYKPGFLEEFDQLVRRI